VSGAPNPTGPPLGKGITAKFFIVKVARLSTEVDDHVGALRRREEQAAPTCPDVRARPEQVVRRIVDRSVALVSSVGGARQHDRVVEEAAVRADLPSRGLSGTVGVHVNSLLSEELHVEEARVARVHESESGSGAGCRSSTGQALPLTVITSPKNSGIQKG
jgi:hypothetical protein